MKKLVTAFALCAAISAMAVESENVVGYQTITCPSGFTVFSPTFLTVGGTPTTYKEITGTMVDGDNLQFFNAGGDVNFTATWYTFELLGLPTGWYDGDFNSLADTEIPAGQGFFVSLASAGSVTVKGQVNASPVTVTSAAGFTVTGNCMPKDTTYGSLIMTGLVDGDNLQFFNAGGDVSFTATWYTFELLGLPTGWYDGDFNSLSATVIPAGQGFFLSTAGAGATLQVPAPM
jgi:hypothetical protein